LILIQVAGHAGGVHWVPSCRQFVGLLLAFPFPSYLPNGILQVMSAIVEQEQSTGGAPRD
jgi:hypothetical protein